MNQYPSKIALSGQRISTSDAIKLGGKKVLVAGRLMSVRGHGKLIFADLKDESGRMQLMFKSDLLADKFTLLKELAVGDFVAVVGEVGKTQAGEISVFVNDLQLLSKAVKQVPSEWFGLKDEEERYRKRYLDLILNDDLKELFKKKAIFWQSIRSFMLSEGFLEVETPILEISAGGADATPFATHHNALDIDLYLRISMGELWQKRLMVGGFEKTFEIGRQFRNEGVSREHLQDYTQMEFYWAYHNYEDSMVLVEKLYKYVIKETFGIDNYGGKWLKVDYREVVKKETGIDIDTISEADLKKKAASLGVDVKKEVGRGRLIDGIWKLIRKSIDGPVFLINHPVEVSPLAKKMADNSKRVERYQVIIGGSEMGNGYSELNDPVDQRQRFEEQQKLRDAGDTEAQMHDRDFVEALEYGMPPVTGFGVSERLFAFLAGKPIRECVLFPLLRPKN